MGQDMRRTKEEAGQNLGEGASGSLDWNCLGWILQEHLPRWAAPEAKQGLPRGLGTGRFGCFQENSVIDNGSRMPLTETQKCSSGQ